MDVMYCGNVDGANWALLLHNHTLEGKGLNFRTLFNASGPAELARDF